MFSKIVKIFFYIVVVIIVGFFFARLATSVSYEITTEIIEEGTYDEYVEISGIALRNETVLYADQPFSSIFYYVNDGDRVARRMPYAAYNETEIADSDQKTLLYLKRKINQLDSSISKDTQYDITAVEDNIKSSIINHLNNAENSEFSSILNTIDNVQIAFNQKEIKQSGVSYFKSAKSKYESQRSDIYNSSHSQEIQLYSPMAGYFYSQCDGYEYINVNDYSQMTVADYYVLDGLQPTVVTPTTVGKLQNEPVWKFIAIVDTAAATNITTGKTVSLEFDVEYVGSVKVATTAEFISRNADGKSVIVFNCNTLNDTLFSLRKEDCHMILKTYTGLKIDNTALRVQDGETGVYVISGQRIIFKPVNILCVAGSYSIVESKNSVGSRVLKVKDEVIINGKDLFDGKIVNNAG